MVLTVAHSMTTVNTIHECHDNAVAAIIVQQSRHLTKNIGIGSISVTFSFNKNIT